MNLGTYVWREVEGKPVFRIQTDDKAVHRYMSQCKEFKLVGQGVNVNLWVYRAEFHSLQKACQVLKFVSQKEIERLWISI